MEGIIPNNLMGPDTGGLLTVIPPDPFGNSQRIFVPRSALVGVEVLGVVRQSLEKAEAEAGAGGPTRPVRSAGRTVGGGDLLCG